jgi:hypothetical protein
MTVAWSMKAMIRNPAVALGLSRARFSRREASIVDARGALRPP